MIRFEVGWSWINLPAGVVVDGWMDGWMDGLMDDDHPGVGCSIVHFCSFAPFLFFFISIPVVLFWSPFRNTDIDCYYVIDIE